jgi:hypothetical protein
VLREASDQRASELKGGGSDSGLTKEHIIPYALQGNCVLPKASCRDCARITGEVERRVLRGPLLSVRAAANFQTRRAENRPSRFPMKVTREGKQEELMVPIEDDFTLLRIPIFAPAAYIDDRPYTRGVQIIGAETIKFGKDPAELMQMFGAQGISVTESYPYVEFARMMAKIAYALAVADFGLDAFEEAYVVPAILGQVDDVGRWIGSDDHVLDVERQGALHAFGTMKVDWEGNGKKERPIVVKVKLFSDAHPHGYEVIVGRGKWREV